MFKYGKRESPCGGSLNELLAQGLGLDGLLGRPLLQSGIDPPLRHRDDKAGDGRGNCAHDDLSDLLLGDSEEEGVRLVRLGGRFGHQNFSFCSGLIIGRV